MENYGGYTGKILYIDLSKKSFKEEQVPEEYIKNFIGGTGINTRLLFDLVDENTEPLSPENALCFGAGPFVGTIIPGSAKSNVCAKSPLNGLIGISGHGLFGKLKFAGYDHLVITGKSDYPVYIKINNNEVEFCNAQQIWGKDVWETTDCIWKEAGTEYEVSTIGPAGENLVKDAAIITNKYAAFARTGMGAVLGSKNVKAIAINGSKPVKVADPKKFSQIVEKLYEDLLSHPNFYNWRKYGTLISLETFAGMGIYAAKNYQEAAGTELLDNFSLDSFLEIKEGDVACLACPIGCKHHLNLGSKEDSPLAISCLNSAMQSYGTFCGSSGWPEVIQCAAIACRMGLDFFSTGGLIALVMELYERGIIKSTDVNNLDLKWGNTDAIKELIKMIAYKEGIGKALAEGLQKAPEMIGENANEYAIHVKGLGLLYDPRVRLQSTEIFSQSTNVRGHTSNVSITMVERTQEQIKKFCHKVGVPEQNINKILNEEGYNVARLTKWTEDVTLIMESLGMCFFPLYQRIDLGTWAELYTALTGRVTSLPDLITASENIWHLRRAFNIREGARRENDMWPKRFLSERVTMGNQQYMPLEFEKADWLISEYYDERGWESSTGEPSKEQLKSLGVNL